MPKLDEFRPSAHERYQVISRLEPARRGLRRPVCYVIYKDRAWPLAVEALPNGNHTLPDTVSYLLGHGPYWAQPRVPVGNKVT